MLVEPTSAVDAHTEARIAVACGGRPPRPDDRGQHGVAAVAAPRRPRRALRERPRDRRRHARGPAARAARPTAGSSRAPRWTHPWRRWPAMSTAVSDPLATSAETWREQPDARAGGPVRAGASARRLVARAAVALHRRHLLREQRALEHLRRVPQPGARLAGGRQPRGDGVLPRPAARAEGHLLLADRAQRPRGGHGARRTRGCWATWSTGPSTAAERLLSWPASTSSPG